MSGIEIAGLVLGALPLVLKSVDAYQDGFSRIAITFNKRQHVAKLARALRLQQHTLEELFKSIVLASGLEDALGVDDDPMGFLNDSDVQEQVEDYLGPKNTSIMIEELKANSEAVGKVARCISSLVPELQGPKDDLLAIIKANQEKPSLMADLGPRLKLVLGITKMKDMIQEIDNCSNALERVSRIALSNCQSVNSKTRASRRSQKLANAFRKIREMAGGLYEAVLDGFQDECHKNHEARLYLDDRVDTAQQVLNRRGAAGADAPLMMFDLIFQAGGQEGDMLYYETAVQVLHDHNNDYDNVEPSSNPGSAKANVTFSVPEDPPDSKFDGATVTNICTTIKEAAAMKSRLAFALLGNRKIAVVPEEDARLAIQSHSYGNYKDYVSLNQVLKTSTTLPWKPRLQLSLQLASSLLQLLQTPWLTQAWHKDAVFFLMPDPPPSGHPRGAKRPAPIDLSRPFVVCSFNGESSPGVSPSETETRAALLELGIILLEIWHGTTLEAHFGLGESDSDCTQPQQPTKYFERLAQALEWEADWTNPMPGHFGESVSQCLRGNSASAGKKLDWEDLSVWSSICGDIIEPLSKLYKNF